MSQQDVTAGVGRIEGEEGWHALVHFPDGSFLWCPHAHATQEECLPCVAEVAQRLEQEAMKNGLTIVREPVR